MNSGNTAQLHEQLVKVADVMPVIVWIAGADGLVFHASAAFYAYIGHRDVDLVSGEWIDTVHPDDREEAIAVWGDSAASGQVSSMEFRLRRHDGRYRWHLLSGQPVRGADGAIAAWYGAALDVDDSRRERDLLVRSEQLLAMLASGGSLDAVLTSALDLLEQLLGGQWNFHVPERPPTVADAVEVFDGHGRIAGSLATSLDLGTLDDFDRSVVRKAVSLVSIALEQDRASHELQDVSGMLRLGTRLSRVGAWSIDVGDDHMTWSDEVCEIHGLAHGSTPSPSEALAFYVGEGRALVRDAVSACALDGVPFEMEVRIVRDDGETRWVRTVGEADRDRNGRILAVRGAVQDITDWHAAEEAMRRTERRFADVARATSDLVWEYDATTDTFWRSDGLNDLFGSVAPSDSDFAWRDVAHPDDVDRIENEWVDALTHGAEEWSAECRVLRDDDTWAEVSVRAFLLHDDGKLVRVVGNVVDITVQRQLERQRLEGQRMEAIGQLTGGVAHDFNNLLTVIIGGAEILERESAPAQNTTAQMIRAAGERGAELTHRLLAFARRQPLEPAATDVHELLAGLDVMLRRTLGGGLDFEYVRASGLWPAMVDGPQLESAVLNLCLNARDAMPDGGRLTIETANSRLDDDDDARHPDVDAGQYVMVAVSDAGIGMEPAVVARVFEPFFTTKAPSSGTGLGLSMVYGFIKQSNGHVKVYSEPGEGTTVRLYLPRAADHPVAEAESIERSARRGHESILVVEDDRLVRDHVVRQLSGLGYQVRAAENADRALELLAGGLTVELLFTDVVMPGTMNGQHLADVVARRWPTTRVLFTSGYTENAMVHHGRLDRGVQLLVKPYRLHDLANRVRAVLDGPAS